MIQPVLLFRIECDQEWCTTTIPPFYTAAAASIGDAVTDARTAGWHVTDWNTTCPTCQGDNQ